MEEVPPEHKKLSTHDYRDVFVGYSKKEIIEIQSKFYYNNEKPKQKFKVPKFKSNKIKTSKYNFINFIPKSLLVQFMRLYNFYFLTTVVLQGIPIVSTMPVYLAALPFVFVLGVSIIRELVEDIKRKMQDRKTNNRKTLILKDTKFHEVRWEQVKVGDIVYMHEGEVFPADLLILTSSDHYGTSYIQTMTLDGERALKSRQAFVQIKDEMKNQFVSMDRIK